MSGVVLHISCGIRMIIRDGITPQVLSTVRTASALTRRSNATSRTTAAIIPTSWIVRLTASITWPAAATSWRAQITRINMHPSAIVNGHWKALKDTIFSYRWVTYSINVSPFNELMTLNAIIIYCKSFSEQRQIGASNRMEKNQSHDIRVPVPRIRDREEFRHPADSRRR